MSTLQKMKPEVEYLLERYPKLRDDDFLLIGAVYHNHGVESSHGFLYVMKQHDSMGLPSFETIRRTRQKVQEERPDLRSSKAKEKERQISYEEFYEFAKGC